MPRRLLTVLARWTVFSLRLTRAAATTWLVRMLEPVAVSAS
jgi:hypothetical protein